MVNLLKLDFYFLICFLFCSYNLFVLINNGQKAVYNVTQNYIDKIHFSLCIDLEESNLSCSQIDDESTYLACSKLFNLSQLSKTNKSPKFIVDLARELEIYDFFDFKDTKNVLYENYLNFASICTAYTVPLQNATESSYTNLEIINRFKIEIKLIFHDFYPFPFITRSYFLECIQFLKCLPLVISIKKFNLILLPKPFKSSCVNYSSLSFTFKKFEEIHSRSHCIMECLKQKSRDRLFFYSNNDEEVLDFNNSLSKTEFSTEYQNCLDDCSDLDCLSVNYFVFGLERLSEGNAIIRIDNKELTYKAIPYICTYTFYLQFFGFISLVFGTSIMTLLYKLETIYSHNSMLKNRLFLSNSTILFIKTFVIILSFFVGIYFEYDYLQNYLDKRNHMTLFHSLNPIYPTPFTAVVCYDIKKCKSLANNSELIDVTLKQLEDDFDCNFKVLSSPPKARFENTQRDVKAIKHKSIYRKLDDKFLKCYSMRILISEPRYRSILFGQYAVINLTNSDNIIFLTDSEKKLENKNKKLKFGFKFKRVTRKVRDGTKCVSDSYLKSYDCDSQANCRERCYLIKFEKKYNSIQLNEIPVYAEYFKNKKIKFNTSNQLDQKIIEECENMYKFKECDKSYITSHEKEIGQEFTNKNNDLIINVQLEHDVITYIQVTNRFELIFHILTLGSVIFSLSLPNLVFFAVRLNKFKILSFMASRKVLSILSVLGFSVHTFFILSDTIYSDLIPEFSNNFQFLEANNNLPILIFCINHQVDLDGGPTLTGEQLYNRTSYIDEKYVFEKIVYHDLKYETKYWYPNQTQPDNLKLKYFFINNYKCFEIHYRLDPNNIYGSYVYNTMRVFLNSSFDQYLFTYRANDSYNLIDYYNFKGSISYYCNFEFMHEEFYDRYQQIRDPKLLFKTNLRKHDVKNYINDLKDELIEIFNYTTTSVPLFKEDFDYEIRNDVFDDVIRFIVEPRESQLPLNKEYERSYYLSVITSLNESKSMVVLKKIFFKGDLYVENKDDPLSIMCNILNALSVWFNLSLINLTHCFDSFRVYTRFKHFFKALKTVNNLNDLKKLFKRKKKFTFKKANYATKLILIDKTKKRITYLE